MPATIRGLLRPLEPSVCETQSVDAAKQTLAQTQSEQVVVRDLYHRPIGVITEEEITRLMHDRPDDWRRKCCAQVVVRMPLFDADAPIAACVEYYRDHGVQSLMVIVDDEPVGLLHPTEVFQWCALWDATAVEELGDLTRPAGPSSVATAPDPHREGSPEGHDSARPGPART